MNKDQVKGGVKQVKGKVQELTGKTVGNRNLEARGDANQIAGKMQRTYGDVKEQVKKNTK